MIRRLFNEQGVPSNRNMGGQVSVPQERAMQYLNKQLGPDEKFLADFEAWRRGQSIKKFTPYAVGATGAGAYLINKAMNQ